MELKELGNKVKEQREYLKKRWRENYAFAKSLGFSAGEASVLSKTSKEEIYRLAQERREHDINE
uniref:Uncharacterized protein n=1 Tax=viral metagenome TaxID=1070528 RepID=A0A6M3LRZ3_9ZZZZ